MADNLKIRKPEDPTKINVNQTWELEFWSNQLGVSKAKVVNAVNKVGPQVSDVKRFLKG